MKEIPYNIMTCITDDIDIGSEFLYLSFQDKRKSSKVYLRNRINRQVPSDIKANYEYPVLRNTGFEIEIEEIPEGVGIYYTPALLISHPDLPGRDKFKYAIQIDQYNYTKFLHLISSSGGIVRRKLNGTFCYDPDLAFFRLEDGNLDKEINLGKILSGKWTKLIPGHEYYIEIGPYSLDILNVVYLGPVSNVKYFKHQYRYDTINLGEKVELNTWTNLVKSEAMLFRDLNSPSPKCPYFVCTKQNLRGVDMGDRGEIMNEVEFEDLCTKESWFYGISDIENQKKYIIKTLGEYTKKNGGRLNSTGLLSDWWKSSTLDFSSYTPDSLFDLLNSKVKSSSYEYFNDMTCFARLFFDQSTFGFSDDDIKEILKGVFEAL